MAIRFSNPYKTAWAFVGVVILAAVLAFGALGAAYGFRTYDYLNAPLGDLTGPDKQPLTRAKFLDLQIAAAVQAASQPKPAQDAPKETK